MKFPDSLLTTLRAARHVAVLTGAGISAESGIPTFREAQTGLWAQYDPQELATPQAFRRDPRLVWEWYTWRRGLVLAAEPNAGHRALAALAAVTPRLTLITQNIDNLHQRAGSPAVIELHGNITRTICFENRHPVTDWAETNAPPPRCPVCGSLLRPDVVWFGESLPAFNISQAMHAAKTCDIFFSIGTSALVYPAAALPLAAAENGHFLVEVNPQQTPLTPYASLWLDGPAGEIMPALLRAAWPDHQTGDENAPFGNGA
ncbi:MAG: NAD-dependent deacylase [Anaerolineales bacterium]|nr:NAD-dependent deacylase [Anaerolineales bacterium]MCB8952252.1 NAD-dependent deacylase [Ardenticatenales bacterium]